MAAGSPAIVESTSSYFSRVHWTGSLSLNWRNVGPKRPNYEAQIQDEVFLGGAYFGLEGPFLENVPVQIEAHVPTSGQGQVVLNQFNLKVDRLENWHFVAGKFIVPFGRYNELYRPDQYLTVTQPLLFASPDNLDLVVRSNSPRPNLSLGYTDIGAQATYYPPDRLEQVPYLPVPSEMTLFIVNGLGEVPNRLRTFPNPDNLAVPPVPGGGTSIDFSHEDNNLADNNNNKVVGGRLVFSEGDLRLPWPISEALADLNGLTFDFSAMDGQYNLEGNLNYQIYEIDTAFNYAGFDFSGAYVYGTNQFLDPVEQGGPGILCPKNSLSCSPVQQNGFEINQGYFLEASFPLLRQHPWAKRLTGVLAFNQMFHRGPILDLLNPPQGSQFNLNGTNYPAVEAFAPSSGIGSTRIDKYTAALNYEITKNLFLKGEYSYWYMKHASGTATPIGTAGTDVANTSLGTTDIYQTALSFVVAF